MGRERTCRSRRRRTYAQRHGQRCKTATTKNWGFQHICSLSDHSAKTSPQRTAAYVHVRFARLVNRVTQTVSGCCCWKFWHGLFSSPTTRPVTSRAVPYAPLTARGSFEQRRAPMRNSLALIALILAAIALAPREASALPISEGAAHSLCQGMWNYNMNTGTSNCAYCERPAGRPICHFFACDEFGCDYVIVDRKRPKGPWRHQTPVLPGTLR